MVDPIVGIAESKKVFCSSAKSMVGSSLLDLLLFPTLDETTSTYENTSPQKGSLINS